MSCIVALEVLRRQREAALGSLVHLAERFHCRHTQNIRGTNQRRARKALPQLKSPQRCARWRKVEQELCPPLPCGLLQVASLHIPTFKIHCLVDSWGTLE